MLYTAYAEQLHAADYVHDLKTGQGCHTVGHSICIQYCGQRLPLRPGRLHDRVTFKLGLCRTSSVRQPLAKRYVVIGSSATHIILHLLLA